MNLLHLHLLRWMLLAAVLLTSPSARAADPNDGWKAVSGASLRSALSNMQLSDGYHYTHRYRSDGTLGGTEMGRELAGRWHVQGKELCTERVKPRAKSECLEVERKGKELRMLQNGYVVLQGQLSRLDKSRP